MLTNAHLVLTDGWSTLMGSSESVIKVVEDCADSPPTGGLQHQVRTARCLFTNQSWISLDLFTPTITVSHLGSYFLSTRRGPRVVPTTLR